jgi:YKOF-related Family
MAEELAPKFEIAVEMSLYPLTADYIPTIKDFIDRLNGHPDLRVVTNSLSTQVFGAHERVFDVLKAEVGRTFADRDAQSGKAVFVMKVLGPLAPA